MKPILPEELRYIHDVMLEKYGGLQGEKDSGMIEYAVRSHSLLYMAKMSIRLYVKKLQRTW